MSVSRLVVFCSVPVFVACSGATNVTESDRTNTGGGSGGTDSAVDGSADGDKSDSDTMGSNSNDGSGGTDAAGGSPASGGSTNSGGDTGSGGATGSGGSAPTICEDGTQDNDGDGSCTAACAADSCENGGMCSDDDGTLSCECMTGWGGTDCSAPDCGGIDCSGAGAGSCDASGEAVVCLCDAGFQDNDGDLRCDAACEIDTCSGHGACSDDSGAIECTCDTGYTGAACDECDTEAGYVADGALCGLPITGGLTAGDPGKWSDGTVATSCQDYLIPQAGYAGATVSGVYEISPDGGTAFEVYCDQVTDGGGWTMFDSGIGNQTLGVSITQNEGTCVLNGDNPQGIDGSGRSDCFFDYDLGFDFNQIIADGLEITAVTGGGSNTSDLTFDDSGDWTRSCSDGDVRFGGANNTGPAMSAGNENGEEVSCGGRIEFDDGETFSFSATQSLATTDDTLRIHMTENGGQAEGWEWTAGRLGVRNGVEAVGALTQADPGEWADGSVAADCAGYAFSGRDGDVLRTGTSASGYFTVDADGDGPGASEVVFCGNGAEWTPILEWDRGSDAVTHTLSSLLAAFTDDLAGPPTGISTMGDLTEQTDYVRWSDVGFTYDVLSYSIDLSAMGVTEVLIDVEFEGLSHEDASIFFYVESAGGPTNLACNEEDVETNGSFSTEEQDLVPYACSSTISGDFTINGQFQADAGEALQSFVMRSHMGDDNFGDTSRLYKLNIAVR